MESDGSSVDIWEVKRKQVSYGEGCYDEISDYLLARIEEAEELENYLFPDLDWFDYAPLPQIIQDAKDPVRGL